MTREEINASFADGWRIDSLEPATIEHTAAPDGLQAWLVVLSESPS